MSYGSLEIPQSKTWIEETVMPSTFAAFRVLHHLLGSDAGTL